MSENHKKAPADAPVNGKHREHKGPAIGKGTASARKLAAAILEVLGGVRMPSDAAAALAVSLPRYYQLEARALTGLLHACEPKPVGRMRSPETELVLAKKEIEHLQHDCRRQQALVRLAQRAVGLAAPQPPKPGGKGLRRRRKPTVRALRAVNVLNSSASGEAEAVLAGEHPAKD